jgi:hypothetical protein
MTTAKKATSKLDAFNSALPGVESSGTLIDERTGGASRSFQLNGQLDLQGTTATVKLKGIGRSANEIPVSAKNRKESAILADVVVNGPGHIDIETGLKTVDHKANSVKTVDAVKKLAIESGQVDEVSAEIATLTSPQTATASDPEKPAKRRAAKPEPETVKV